MSYRILVVDDSKDMTELMELLLGAEGYDVAVAADGLEALTKLETESLPNLIFLDHNMAPMDGPSFLIEFERVSPKIFASIPIIMMSAHDSDFIAANHATEILRKPIDIQFIILLVKRYMDLVGAFA